MNTDEDKDKVPIRWGTLRLVLAAVALTAGGQTLWWFVSDPTLNEVMKQVWRTPQRAAFGVLGVLAALVVISALTGFTVWLLFGFRHPLDYMSDWVRRNWTAYRVDYSRADGQPIVRHVYVRGSHLDTPQSAFSINTDLRGGLDKAGSCVLDWRSGVREVVWALRASRPERIDGVYQVRLQDYRGNRVWVYLEEALDWWIPKAMSQQPPSLTYAATAAREELRDREVLARRFNQQHAIAEAAIGVIWETIWGIFNTSRLDGVGSREGKTVRGKLTRYYQSLKGMAGADDHDFSKYLPGERQAKENPASSPTPAA